MPNSVVLLISLLLPGVALAQTNISWKMLEDLEFVEKFLEDELEDAFVPEFGASLKALEGKEVTIKGFILPIDPEKDIYILSRHPFSSCFFCGSGGVESVIELMLKPGHDEFKQDEIRTVKGILRLNADNVEQLVYVLEEAECYSPREEVPWH